MSSDAGAAAPGAVSQRATFLVTVSGSISSAVNTYPDVSARCRPTTEVGVWRLLTFRSARPTRVTVVGGGPAKPVRFRRGKVRRLVGDIHLAAPSQYEVACSDGSHTTVRGNYFTGSTSWRGGVVRLSSPRKGRIAVGPLRGVPEDPGGACGETSGPLLRLQLARGPFAESRLFDRAVERLVVRGGMHRSLRLSPSCGVSEAVDWTLVLRRIR